METHGTAGAINEPMLEEKLGELEQARHWSPRIISRLEALIRSSEPFQLYRVNPLKFAADRNMAEQEAIDLFLHATKLGLFRMEWRLLCPTCGDTLESFSNLGLVQTRCFCNL